METIHIEITSDRGMGATTVAMLIGRLLKSKGFAVSYEPSQGRGSVAAKCFESRLAEDDPLDLSLRRRILLVDRGA